MTILVIVESPAKAKTIRKYLGDGFDVDSSAGHIRDLPASEMGFNLEDMKPEYVVLDDKKAVVARLKKKSKGASKVLLATDLDREGEAIAWHLLQVLRPSAYERIVFNEITPKALKHAVQNPVKLDLSKVAAQECRRLLDRFVGYSVSPWLKHKMPGRGRLSAGRVQTIALRIVVEREDSILNFNSEPYYVVKASHAFNGIEFHSVLDASPLIPDDQKIRHLTDLYTAQNICDFILQKQSLRIVNIDKKERQVRPPPAFTTSTLQQAASNSLGFAPKLTMSLAQKLYESGLITYMRTDSLNLSDEAIHDIRTWLAKLIAHKNIAEPLLPDNPNKWKSADGAQDAHEGIRPSNISDLGKGIEGVNERDSDQLRKLYQLIWRRAVASQMSPAVYDQTIVTFHSHQDPKNGTSYTFISRGSVLRLKGWRFIMNEDGAEDGKSNTDEDTAEQHLPSGLRSGDTVPVKEIEAVNRRTKPPSRFSEAALIKELERQGVGRPSTFATTIDTIVRREYVCVSKKKQLLPTELGIDVIKAVGGNFRFVEITYTREIEGSLDLVASGSLPFKTVLRTEIQQLQREIEKQGGIPDSAFKKPKIVKDCPACKVGKLVIRDGKNEMFLGCNRYPKCKHSENLTS